MCISLWSFAGLHNQWSCVEQLLQKECVHWKCTLLANKKSTRCIKLTADIMKARVNLVGWFRRIFVRSNKLLLNRKQWFAKHRSAVNILLCHHSNISLCNVTQQEYFCTFCGLYEMFSSCGQYDVWQVMMTGFSFFNSNNFNWKRKKRRRRRNRIPTCHVYPLQN